MHLSLIGVCGSCSRLVDRVSTNNLSIKRERRMTSLWKRIVETCRRESRQKLI